MSNQHRETGLRVVLVLVGIAFLSLYPLGLIWPSGWLWGMGMAHSHYLYMLFAVYTTLAVFLFITSASRAPLRYLSLIWFTVWSSLAHAAVMAAQALLDTAELGHLLGDVPALVIVALLLGVFARRASFQK